MMSPQEMAHLHSHAQSGHRAWSEKEFADLCADHTSRITCGKHCFSVTRVVLDEAELLLIVTDINQRNKGYARQCLNKTHKSLEAEGVCKIHLEVAESNAAARKLYQSNGYEIIGQRRNYYKLMNGQSDNALLMQLHLPSAI